MKKYSYWGKIFLFVSLCLLFGTCKLGTDIDTLRERAVGDKHPPSYTVTFNSNGGSGVPDQIVNSGATATRPANPTRSGYAFDNWYSNAGLTTVYNFSTPVTGNITLYAWWVTSPEMVYVPGGSFQMGSDNSLDNYASPVHTVTMTGFYMGKYEVTQAQYQVVMGTNPSEFNGFTDSPNRPVECVSWYDAIKFCNKLSMMEGLTPAYRVNNSTDPSAWVSTDDWNWTWNAVEMVSGSTGYRLPTEAQWEYAAKGGNGSPGNYTYAGSNNPDEVAWYDQYGGSTTRAVGTKAPNGLGLYDMSGNVGEWCWDWYGDYPSEAQTNPAGASSGSSRVLRGGGWYHSAESVRSASRSYSSPILWGYVFGFRLVRP